jgi:hypothetical protein
VKYWASWALCFGVLLMGLLLCPSRARGVSECEREREVISKMES